MKIAVSAEGTSLDASMDARFGRCSYFLLVDPEDMNFEVVENTNKMLSNGAGIQSAMLVSEKGARIVLTGKCGPNSMQALSAAGISVITDCSGTVRSAVEQYKRGELTENKGVKQGVADTGKTGGRSSGGYDGGNTPGGGGIGRGMGLGGGRGRGMGGCRGMGGGGMRRFGFSGDGIQGKRLPQNTSIGAVDDVESLKSEADSLNRRLAEVQRKIEIMEKQKK
ncbi:MAG: NifB/NifX family molybdenum-iron cluster-binding protein [Desulfobacterales bacterium]